MESLSKVVLVKCDAYKIEKVRSAVRRGIDLLGGAGIFARSGEKILVKPNMLVAETPDSAVSPHPYVFQAILEEFKSTGAKLSFGDSPAVGSPHATAQVNGFLKVAEELDVPLADFQNAETVSFPEGNIIKQFSFAKGVLEADGLISVCKLKTHALTRITGAIKNQFGCIPGVRKSEFHSILPNATVFSRMLVDINLCLKPRLFIMDGITAMEGNGPRSGTKRQMNVILMSTDPVALDTVVCRMINLDENLVDTIVYGEKFGLGNTNVEIAGDPLEEFITPDFNVNRAKTGKPLHGRFMPTGFLRKYVSRRPVINSDLCRRCGKCEEICPANPKAIIWDGDKTYPPSYDYSRCIRCFCCQELCPFKAISTQVPLLGRIIHR
jgi:uncharacterized protein (DUF362 family)/Pyruvate/2-oxoacid:ferredoxin oxidoreductase delta subunit